MAIDVKATQAGYYEGRRRKGDRFVIRDEKHFSKKWMAKVEAKADKGKANAKPEKVEAKAGDGDQPPPKPDK